MRGEGAASAPKRDVSDYGLVLKRGEKEVSLDLDFAVSGSQSVQKIHGRLEFESGDMRLDIQLDRLPLAPYAAVLPSVINLHDTSVIEDTNVSIEVDNKARSIVVEGQASINDIDLRAPKISRHVMTNLSLRTKGRLSLDLAKNRLSLSEGELQLGKMLLMLNGSISEFRSAPDFDMQLKVPSISCQDMASSLIPDIAPMLDGMRCRGQLSFRLDFKLNTTDMKSMKLRYLPSLRRVEVTSLGRYIDLSVLDGPFEHHARQPDGSLYTFVTGPGSERWAPLEGISDDMIKVVTTTEDGNFFKHDGFSLLQIRSAMITNLLRGRFVRGASTISQQVVKNLFFVEREKTLARKLQEAVITWHIERSLTKQQILALYFNIIEFGPKVYGIRAASRHFFHREPLQLNLTQCLWLGSIIPNPRAFYHQFSEANMRPSWRRHLCVIADIMVKRTKITAAQRAALTDCTVSFGVAPEPEIDDQPGLGHEAAIDETIAPPKTIENAGAVEAEDAP
ncbi:MAG TPA: hypothetical protein DCQ06_10815 [Myxococcales bacterium]|nr:hypothetical protein [Myxococcales bacterium]